jgi:nitroreductase
MDVQTAMITRRSVRAFSPRPVPAATLRAIFERAQQAPSWCNIQPWRVWLASGQRRDALVAELVAAATSRMPSPDVPFPHDYPEPYGQLRRDCGKALYTAMGVAKGDGPARQAAWMRNFLAFDAPHVAIVGIDRRFSVYGALDLGCWLQSVMLLAIEEGVSSCAQASLAIYPDVCRTVLGVTDDVQILCGIGLGYEEAGAPANDCRTSRDPVEKNVVFLE